ncbi:aldose epimerase family protein [Rhodobacteraceae bacterium DSL-40]|uniref:aldose epimerase family protein n=1 Tax=Amaricoccus sp. B4 TaxID=3368557 RepID=UPI000DAC4EEF
MKKRHFGKVDQGQVEELVLESADAAVSILNYGCITRDWRVDGPRGSLPMVLGFPDIGSYVQHSRGHGAIVGRVANRTANAEFKLEGKTYHLTRNHGPKQQHHIHGCLADRLWEMEGDSTGEAVHLRYLSPDGEDGFPGSVDFRVTYRLEGPKLVCEMSGLPDRPTPINLAHHNYFNLGGTGTVRDHVLWIDAEDYTPLDAENIPLGTIAPVEGTHLDFCDARSIEESDPERKGIDNNYILRPGRDQSDPAAWASCPRTGLRLRVWTDQPGLQIFNAATMTIGAPGLGGETYGPFAGLCFEAQHYPDSLHNPDWPSIIRSPETPYFQRLEVEISKG